MNGLYEVSNLGRVKKIKRKIKNKYIDRDKAINTILKGSKTQKGYHIIKLTKDKKIKTIGIHRLVAEAFIPNPNNLPQVNHKDENKTNNKVNNLEWCTVEYNNNYGTKKERLKAHHNPIIYESLKKKVIQYDKNMNKIAEYSSISEASKKNKINDRNISSCCKQKRKTAGGFIWRHKN